MQSFANLASSRFELLSRQRVVGGQNGCGGSGSQSKLRLNPAGLISETRSDQPERRRPSDILTAAVIVAGSRP